MDEHTTFTQVVGYYTISLEFTSANELLLQAKKADELNTVNAQLMLNKAISDYYDIETSVASMIHQYSTMHIPSRISA